jgi:hypothetical protein
MWWENVTRFYSSNQCKMPSKITNIGRYHLLKAIKLNRRHGRGWVGLDSKIPQMVTVIVTPRDVTVLA